MKPEQVAEAQLQPQEGRKGMDKQLKVELLREEWLLRRVSRRLQDGGGERYGLSASDANKVIKACSERWEIVNSRLAPELKQWSGAGNPPSEAEAAGIEEEEYDALKPTGEHIANKIEALKLEILGAK